MSTLTFFSVTRDALASRLKRSVKHSVATVKATPEAHLDYKPSETARSVRELAQHAIEGNNYCLQALKLAVQGNDSVASIDELAAELQKTGDALTDFVSALTEEQMVSTVSFFGGDLSMIQMVLITEWHLSRHSAQIDYLQTTWNDLEDRY